MSAGRYEVIESKVWRNARTGASASIYGAVPWVREAEKADWALEVTGFTVYDSFSGRVGIGRVPWKTRAEAEAFVAKNNSTIC